MGFCLFIVVSEGRESVRVVYVSWKRVPDCRNLKTHWPNNTKHEWTVCVCAFVICVNVFIVYYELFNVSFLQILVLSVWFDFLQCAGCVRPTLYRTQKWVPLSQSWLKTCFCRYETTEQKKRKDSGINGGGGGMNAPIRLGIADNYSINMWLC